MKYLILTLLGILIACAGGGGDSAGACGGTVRETRSIWVTSGGTESYDLRGIVYGAGKSIKWYPSTAYSGARCSCTVDIIGAQEAGAFNITACSYDAGTGAGDPGCAAHTGLLYYSNSNSILTLGTESATTQFHACYTSGPGQTTCLPEGP